MSAAEQIAKQLANAANVRKVWQDVIINVKEYGALGGTHDDTTAFQQAINYAISTGKSDIWLPPGTYTYTTLTGTEGITFYGDNVTLNGTTVLNVSSFNAMRIRIDSFTADTAELEANQGDLTQLNTADKTSLVNALKEVKTQADTTVTTITNIGNASPKGTYATLTALQTAFPTGATGIYIVTADGKWYYWNGTAWTGGGVYQSTGIADGTVFPESTVFMKRGKNLFNKDTSTAGYYVDGTNGNLVANAALSVSDYMDVTASTQYTQSKGHHIAFYDSAKVFISGQTLAADTTIPRTFTSPAGARYMRSSCYTQYLIGYQIELGASTTSFEPYGPKMDYLQISQNALNALASSGRKLGAPVLSEYVKGKNLFDSSKRTLNNFVDASSGALSSNTTYDATDYIPVVPGQTYSASYKHQVAFYDSGKLYVSGISNIGDPAGHTFVVPAGCYFVRQGVDKNYVSTFQLELGSVKTAYEPYLFTLSGLSVDDPTFKRLLTVQKLPIAQLSEVGPGVNLADKTKFTSGQFPNYQTGLLQASASYSATDYIPVDPNTQYFQSFAHQTAFYDANKVYISGLNSPSTAPEYPNGRAITTPANTKYVRCAVGVAYVDSFQLEIGSIGTAYSSYQLKIQSGYIPQITESMLKDGVVSKNKLSFLERKNIVDESKAVTGFFVSSVTGTLTANATYFATDFTAVDPNTVYTQSADGQLAFYDASKAFISGLTGDGTSGLPKTYTTPANAAYVRCSTKNIDTFQLEKGSTSTEYVPYASVYLPADLIPKSAAGDDILVFLPTEICVAVGRTIELYNKQVAWCGNIDNYHFKWDCQVGSNLKRKFSVKGVTVGNYPLTLNVYNNNMALVKTASTTIKVVAASVAARTVLCIGDSLTNNTSTPKPWMGEVRSLSANNVSFVGTRGTTTGEKHEGRSGFTAGNYLTATAYSFEGEGVHPFWDGSRFNWSYYKTNTGINPNAVQIWLGTNGIALDPTTNAGNIKQMIDYIRQDDASIPIYVVFTLYRGNQNGLGVQTSVEGYAANRGAWEVEEAKKVYNLMVRLNDLLSAYTNLYFTPVSLAHDSEYNFGAVSTPVNPRAAQTELLPTEATHPQSQGYLQIADIMFSVFATH